MRRRSFMTVAAALGVLVFVSPSQAQIFRCPSPSGVVFQQAPCDGLGASGGRLLRSADGRSVSAPEPPVPVPVAAAASVASAPRVYGRTPLPNSISLASGKTP